MGNLGWTEIGFILVIALIIFGPRKLPELGKSLGGAIAQFKRASEDFKRSWEEEVELEKERTVITTAIQEETTTATTGETNPETAGTVPASEQKPVENWM